MAPFDYKKEDRALYQPPQTPMIVRVPPMQYLAVQGQGDPNQPGGEYAAAVQVLYALAYAVRMAPRAGQAIPGYFEFVVPPLEGFWWMDGVDEVDYSRKARFNWVSVLRAPQFVTPQVLAWAQSQVKRKKGLDATAARLLALDEGLCVQCMHLGSYNSEPATVAGMEAFIRAQGYRTDITAERRHHEIYLSDPRKAAPGRQKTVLRHPIAPLPGV